ncbi:MAG: tRNA (adenine-N1)-methyltransferase [Candidatus Pacebacteria bacterium]|nr:tRNA (adenine-N1)-methyltransferase [Candidatus Paceibacterota bacterium]
MKDKSFKVGDLVLLIDSRGKKYLVKIKDKKASFHFHRGEVRFADIIGKKEGDVVFTSKGERVFLFLPTLWEYILKMKRGAQVIYPKDIGEILILADVFCGAKVLEAGTGSGALTLGLLRAVGKYGKVVSYEKRKEFFEIAKNNIEKFQKIRKEEWGKLELKNKDLKKGIDEKNFDRAFLDLPDPWNFLEIVKKALKPGGILTCYLPTVLQVFNLVETVEEKYSKDFYLMGIYEILKRDWQKREKSLRPKDRMVAHTGFIILFKKINR